MPTPPRPTERSATPWWPAGKASFGYPGRPDAAFTILPAAPLFEPQTALDTARVAQTDTLRTANSEHFDAWWATGARLDVQAAVTLVVSALTECLAST